MKNPVATITPDLALALLRDAALDTNYDPDSNIWYAQVADELRSARSESVANMRDLMRCDARYLELQLTVLSVLRGLDERYDLLASRGNDGSINEMIRHGRASGLREAAGDLRAALKLVGVEP